VKCGTKIHRRLSFDSRNFNKDLGLGEEMCGIAGIVGVDRAFPLSSTVLRQMCSEIVYRGPDDEGLLTKEGVGLAMRRLSIIDVTGGHQPIPNEDFSIWIVFNGEIYNFEELRLELEAKGHKFRTNSDTEAIVHAYESFGDDCVNKLRGMFAFAIYDFKKRALFLARDRIGKKPLHYAVHNGVLYFASEIKSILTVVPELAEVDQAAIAQYFYYGYILDPFTIFKGIKKLPPGHTLSFDDHSLSVNRYWDLAQFGSGTLPEPDFLRKLEHTLTEAVRIRLISEVSLGALLSGGVDSSTIVAIMAKISSSRVKTFSIGFKKADFDETRHARAVAAEFGTEHHELIVDADVWATMEKLTSILDEPFADSSIIPTYHVAKMARQYVTVALSGDGGDELFAGYDRYFIHYKRRYLDLIPRWVAPVYHNFVYPMVPLKWRSRKITYNFVLNARDRYLNGLGAIHHDPGLAVLSPEFLDSVAKCDRPELIAQRHYDNSPGSDIVGKMQYTDIKTYLTADVLTKVDRMSMACSLEVRCPLLDHLFVELATQLPLSMRIRNGTRKYLLRRLAERLGVPRETLYRRKQGFALPLMHWMRNELKLDLTNSLLESRTINRGYFRKSAIERTLKEHRDNERDHSALLWQLLAFEFWHRNYLERRAIAIEHAAKRCN
jgi:asparagine synthase (glutamine-hydrolysing)